MKESGPMTPKEIKLATSVLCAFSFTASPGRGAGEAVRGAVAPSVRFAGDARLDQKVSLTTWAEPLEDVLAQLSHESGVQLRFEGRDVGDQRVNVRLTDQPLRRVQTLLADVLDLYWRRERQCAAYRYVLFQDLRSRKREAELRAGAGEQFEEGVRRLVASLTLAPRQIETLREQNGWWANWLSDPGRRQAIELLGRLGPSRWDRLMQTGRVELPFAGLSRADQELVRQYVQVSNQQRDRDDQEQGTPGQHHIGDVTAPGAQIAITIFGGVPAGPDSSVDFSIEPAEGQRGGHGLGLGYTEEEHRGLREAFAPPGFEPKKRNPPPDGGPHVAVAWKQKPKRWEEVLKALAEAADLQVISDSYLYYWWEENTKLPDAAALRDRPLQEVLDQVAAPFFYGWRRDGDVYLFRNRNWFLEKAHDVPERRLRRWREHLNATSRLTPEDLAELAALSRRQLRSVNNAGIPADRLLSAGFSGATK
jgi:hypothetical protein